MMKITNYQKQQLKMLLGSNTNLELSFEEAENYRSEEPPRRKS